MYVPLQLPIVLSQGYDNVGVKVSSNSIEGIYKYLPTRAVIKASYPELADLFATGLQHAVVDAEACAQRNPDQAVSPPLLHQANTPKTGWQSVGINGDLTVLVHPEWGLGLMKTDVYLELVAQAPISQTPLQFYVRNGVPRLASANLLAICHVGDTEPPGTISLLDINESHVGWVLQNTNGEHVIIMEPTTHLKQFSLSRFKTIRSTRGYYTYINGNKTLREWHSFVVRVCEALPVGVVELLEEVNSSHAVNRRPAVKRISQTPDVLVALLKYIPKMTLVFKHTRDAFGGLSGTINPTGFYRSFLEEVAAKPKLSQRKQQVLQDAKAARWEVVLKATKKGTYTISTGPFVHLEGSREELAEWIRTVPDFENCLRPNDNSEGKNDGVSVQIIYGRA